MGDVVNLRTARKRKARADKERQAAENRILHGRTKSESTVVRSINEAMKARHDAHLREGRSPDDDA